MNNVNSENVEIKVEEVKQVENNVNSDVDYNKLNDSVNKLTEENKFLKEEIIKLQNSIFSMVGNNKVEKSEDKKVENKEEELIYEF